MDWCIYINVDIPNKREDVTTYFKEKFDIVEGYNNVFKMKYKGQNPMYFAHKKISAVKDELFEKWGIEPTMITVYKNTVH